MIRVEIHETIERPIEDVFEQLIDIDGYRDWMPDGGLLITTYQRSDGPVEVGTTYVDRTRVGAVKGEVAELERPTRVLFHYVAEVLGLVVMHGWPGYTLEPLSDDATRVHHIAEARLRGPFKLLTPVIQRMATAERTRTMRALKTSLKAG